MARFRLLLCLIASPGIASPFTVQETRRSYATLQQAVSAIGNGDGSILIAPGRYYDCAVQIGGNITYFATMQRAAIFSGRLCEGKAVLVLRGRSAKVEGLTFENLRSPDGNGAGIRIEQGNLWVRSSAFRNSDEGILGGGEDNASDVLIERTIFSGLGRCDRGLACAHSAYLSAFRSVTVRHSRFEKGRGGHYLKSRSRWIDVSDCSFDDRNGSATNYMIDLPDGASGRIVRNTFVQGTNKENHSAFIAVAAEARRHNSSNLMVLNNQAVQLSPSHSSAFILDWSGSVRDVSGNQTGARVRLIRRIDSEKPGLFRSLEERLHAYISRMME